MSKNLDWFECKSCVRIVVDMLTNFIFCFCLNNKEKINKKGDQRQQIRVWILEKRK